MFEEDDNDILPLYQDPNPPEYEIVDKRLSYSRIKHVISDKIFEDLQDHIKENKKFKISPTYNFYFRVPRPCHIGIACPIFNLEYELDYMEDNKCFFKTKRDFKNVKWYINIDTLNITWYSTNFILPTITYNYKFGLDFFYELKNDVSWDKNNLSGEYEWGITPYFYSEQKCPIETKEEVEEEDEYYKMIVKNINTLFI